MEEVQQTESKERDWDKGKRKVEKGNENEDDNELNTKRKKTSTESKPSSTDRSLIPSATATTQHHKVISRSDEEIQKIQRIRVTFVLDVITLRDEFSNILNQLNLVMAPWSENSTLLYPARVVLELDGISDRIIMQHPSYSCETGLDNSNGSNPALLLNFLYRKRYKWVKRDRVHWISSPDDLDTLDTTKGNEVEGARKLLMRLQGTKQDESFSVQNDEKGKIVTQENEFGEKAESKPGKDVVQGENDLVSLAMNPSQPSGTRDSSSCIVTHHSSDELKISGISTAMHSLLGTLRQSVLGSTPANVSILGTNPVADSEIEKKVGPEVPSIKNSDENQALELIKCAPSDPVDEQPNTENSSTHPHEPKSEPPVVPAAKAENENVEAETSVHPSGRLPEAKETEALRNVVRANAIVSMVASRLERFNCLDDPEVQNVHSWAYNGGVHTEVVVFVPGCGISIKRSSMRLLSQSQWLDCDILGAYSHLINERNLARRNAVSDVPQHGGDNRLDSAASGKGQSVARVYCFDSFFYTLLAEPSGTFNYERVRNYTRPRRSRSEARSGFSALDTDLIMFPVHVEGNHWVLSIIDMKAGVLFFADPQDLSKSKKKTTSRKKTALQILGNLRHWLEDELQTKNGVTMVNERRVRDFQLQWDLLVPKQRDSGSCGVFTMMYGEAIEWYGHLGTFDFDARDTRGMRDRMALELLAKRLSLYTSS